MMNNNRELATRIFPKKVVDRIDKKIKLLGVSSKIDTITFLSLRLITTAMLFILVVYIFRFGYIFAPIISVLYYYMFGKVLLDDRIKVRTKKLEMEAMNFFEILTLSLETGRNLEEALTVTTNSLKSELCDEFKEAIREVSFGKSLIEALNDMEENIPSDTINNIVLSLTQADMFGSSIINNLYNQIDYLREKRVLEVKATISKVPIKISVISVLFFVPLMLLIILAPVLLNYIM